MTFYVQTPLTVMISALNKISFFFRNKFNKNTEYWYSNFDNVRSKREIRKSVFSKILNKRLIKENIELKIAVLCHLYYFDLWPEFKKYLRNIKVPFDLYVNLVEGSASFQTLIKVRQQIMLLYPNATIIISDNRGLDIGGTLSLISIIADKNIEYDLFLKIHTKKSFESTTKKVGNKWRRELLNSLLGSPRIVKGILTLFKENPRLGMLGSKTWHIKAADNYYFAVSSNESGIKSLCSQLNINENIELLEFFGGTMFWIDAKTLLNKLKGSNINLIINNLEVGYFNADHESTLTHSLERIFGLLILNAKKEIVSI